MEDRHEALSAACHTGIVSPFNTARPTLLDSSSFTSRQVVWLSHGDEICRKFHDTWREENHNHIYLKTALCFVLSALVCADRNSVQVPFHKSLYGSSKIARTSFRSFCIKGNNRNNEPWVILRQMALALMNPSTGYTGWIKTSRGCLQLEAYLSGLWLSEIASSICIYYLSVTARPVVSK